MIGNWTTCTINDCCEILDSFRVPLNSEERNRIQGSIPYYGANGVQGFINKFIFDEDLILMAEDGGNFEQFATRPIAYKISGKSWVNNHAHILKTKAGFDQDFVFYSIVHKNILFHIQGGTRSKLNQSDLKSISIEIPKSKIEQTKIASILTIIDQAIDKTEQLIAKYERIKTGLMQDLLTRGIDEQGNIRSEETHEFKDSVLGRIPKEWEVYKVSDLGEWKGGKTPRKSVQRYWKNAQYLWYSSKDVIGDILMESFYKITAEAIQETNQGVFPANDSLIFVFRSGILRHKFPISKSKKPFSVNQDLKVLVPKKGLSSDFLFQKFKSLDSYFLKVAVKVGTTVESVDGHVFFGTEIGIPKSDEQSNITEKLKGVDIEHENLALELLKYKHLKTALMQDLLTGKVRVDNLIN